jgi:putative CocE/NonD family hydrolase
MAHEEPRPPTPAKVIKNVRIPMPDGVQLAADLFMPEGPGAFPAVLEYIPYRKDDLTVPSHYEHHYFAQHGFVGVRLDVRGTGGSSGIAENEYVLQEQLDAVVAIDWLSKQPWCSGSVGMTGISYGGFTSVQVAMHRPPALKAIVPIYYTDDRYTDDCHYVGGALRMYYDLSGYGINMVGRKALPPYPEYTGPDWAAIWQERLEQNEPWFFDWITHQTDGPYWRHASLRENYAAIQCPTFIIAGWRDGYPNPPLRTFAQLQAPKKILFGPWLHMLPDQAAPGPRVDYLREMVRWWDHWLKGIDTGIMDEPAIALYVQEFDDPRGDRTFTSGFWRSEAGWPLERAQEQTLYLAESGGLSASRPAAREAVDSFEYNATVGMAGGLWSGGLPFGLPTDQRPDEAYSLVYTTELLSEDLEILGYPQAVLHAASTAPIAFFIVKLADVAPDGASALVTKGVLNATRRASLTDPEPLTPGEVYELTIPLDCTAWRFRKGHRIRVAIASADFPNVWPSPLPATNAVHRSVVRPSRIVLPVTPPQNPPLPAPELVPPSPVVATATTYREPWVWNATRDVLGDRATVETRTANRVTLPDGIRYVAENSLRATASARDPADATLTGASRTTVVWAGRTTESYATGSIHSTADAFHVSINLEIRVDGALSYQRQWLKSVPRRLL